MRIVSLAVLALGLLAACKDDEASTGASYGIADSIIAVDRRTFTAFDGNAYTLARVEYGANSVYCSFTVGGEEYPIYADFQTDEDVLFDEDEDLTGWDLAIFDDEDFDAWMWDTDADDDVLIECF